MKRLVNACIRSAAAAALCTIALSSGASAQQKFPDKPIELIVWTSAGGGGDLFARAVASLAEPDLGVPVVVQNKVGGATAIGRSFVGKSAPDGSTLLSATGNLTLTPFTAAPEYDYKAFSGIIRLVVNDALIVVRKEAPWNNLDDLFKDAATGKRLTVGGVTDLAGNDGLVGFQLAKAGKFKLNWLTYDGAGDETAAMLGGHLDVAIGDASTFLGHVKDGRAKVLAVASKKRVPYLPDVATAEEQGHSIYWEDYRGFLVPKGTPPERIKVLHDAFRKVMDHPKFADYLANTGQRAGYLGPAEFDQYLADLSVSAGAMLKEIGIIKK
jgi:tripartite-type tricarboxylate transporter receptor subunit TctC